MSDKKIVIASVLKPVDDIRMFWKFAVSLSKLEGLSVHVVGFKGKIIEKNNITLHPLFRFRRFDLFKRFIAPWKFFFVVKKIKPDILIIGTHELIIPALALKLCCKTKLIYDIRENYFLNILSTNAFPVVLRQVLARWVRVKEHLSAPAFSLFFLAEKVYSKQLSFIKKKYEILENKCVDKKKYKSAQKGFHKFLFTGTIAEETGIFVCINLVKKLHALDPLVSLLIIGFCPKSSTYLKIKGLLIDCPFITFIGGNTLVSHDEITEEILKADIGLICYPPNRHINGKIPTKLYEYLGYRLPFIAMSDNHLEPLYSRYSGAVPIHDFSETAVESLLETLRNTTFYKVLPGPEVYWTSEETVLHKCISTLLND